jgi:hypothetical protein
VPSLRIRIRNTEQNKLCPLTELNEGRLAGGHLHDGAAQGPDVGRGAVPTLPFVYHLHKREEIHNNNQDTDPGSESLETNCLG